MVVLKSFKTTFSFWNSDLDFFLILGDRTIAKCISEELELVILKLSSLGADAGQVVVVGKPVAVVLVILSEPALLHLPWEARRFQRVDETLG